MTRLVSAACLVVAAWWTSWLAAAEPPNLLGDLPADCAVLAVGTYCGSKPLDFQIDASGHDARQADIVVNYPAKPVVLVLTAYEPMVWRVGRTADTRIVGVLVSGYHKQVLTGVPQSTPHAVSSYEKRGAFDRFYAYDEGAKLDQASRAVEGLIGRKIDRLTAEYNRDTFYVGDPPADADDVIYSDELTVEEHISPVLSGGRALQQMVRDGLLRSATQADVEAWLTAFNKRTPDVKAQRYARGYLQHYTMYVVLKKCALPEGLYGANSAWFFVPEDVPFPDGPPCHNAFFLMDGTARGTGALPGR